MNLLKESLIVPALTLLLYSNVYAEKIYNLESMPLKEAIEKISEDIGLPYIVDSNLLKDKKIQKMENIKGSKNALSIILKECGLEAEIKNDTIIIKEKKSENTNSLGEINVLASADGLAEDGYLSKDISGIGLWGNRSLQDTPYQMSVISQEMIENTASGIDQIFKMNPVVQVKTTSTSSHSWNTPNMNIRGFDVSGNHILEGIPFSWVEGVTTEELERIEVLNGLTGFLYGVGYVGGAVNYVTKKPTLERLTNLTIGTSGNEAAYIHADLGGKIDEKGKFSYRLNALKQNGETSIENQKIDRELVAGALDWRITDDLIFTFDAYHKKNNTDKLTSYFVSSQSATILNPKQGYAPDWTFSDSSQDRLGFKSLWQINDNIKLRTAYIHLDHENDMSMPYVYDNSDGTYSFNYYRAWPQTSTTQGAYVYADIDFSTLKVEHTLTMGVSGNKTKSNSIDGAWEWVNLGNYTLEQLNNISRPTYVGNENNKTYLSSRNEKTNFMIGDDIRFNENWSALVGFNYAKVEEKNYNIDGEKTGGYDADDITPSISLIYKPFEDLTTYATYMESLESGTIVGDLYSNAGEIFNPYVSKQYEIGAKYSLSENLLLSSALFRIEKANSYEESEGAGLKLTQDGLVIHQGLELTLTGKVTENLTVVAGGTIMDLKIDKANTNEGKKPTDTASKMAKLYAEYNIPFIQGLTITGGAYWTGKSYRDVANTDVIPSYTVYDGGLRYKTTLDKYPTTYIVNVTNLTNKEYWRSSTSFGEPLNIAFSMKMEF
ncbi:TonB-dependent siderophore receptor [Halarcobacter ebronensis]|uniref:TonB-dependent siderophore receptor n=1 Tax=Halarcobacter ebronensis TaxID=1462615 RepID=A0A4Q0YEM2_9BACT|nr:TonB-dependent siderophore receptor [Halarcobacter ebronensis]RXJ68920.1 TonB-dependent siderophore receptor [Halarcobacter ebronensis]